MGLGRPLAYAALAVGVVLAALLAGLATGTARVASPGLILTLSTVFAVLVAAAIVFSELSLGAKLLLLGVLAALASLAIAARASPRLGLALLAVAVALILAYVAVEARRLLLERYR